MERVAVIVAGFGFRAAADLSALEAALANAQQGQPPITTLAAPHDKLTLPTRLAEAMNLPIVAISPGQLKAASTQTQSQASLDARGTGSVAEACALAAAGPGARLRTPRHISPDHMATCAIAEGFPA